MSSPTMDQTQRRIMMFLPLLFVIFIINFPAGVIVYWITTNTWTMGQQYVIKRRLGPVTPAPAAAVTAARAAGGDRPWSPRVHDSGGANASARTAPTAPVAAGSPGCCAAGPSRRSRPRVSAGNRSRARRSAAAAAQEEEALRSPEVTTAGRLSVSEPADASPRAAGAPGRGDRRRREPSRSTRTRTVSPAEFVGDDLGIVIGHHGQTIDAIQHLAYRIAFTGAANREPGRRRRRRLPRAPCRDAPRRGRSGRRDGCAGPPRRFRWRR